MNSTSLLKPRFTLQLVDNKLGKEMTVGTDSFPDFKKKTISGRSMVYELLDRFKDEVLSEPTK